MDRKLSKENLIKEIKAANGPLWIKFFGENKRNNFVLFQDDAISAIEQGILRTENIDYVHIVYRIKNDNHNSD